MSISKTLLLTGLGLVASALAMMQPPLWISGPVLLVGLIVTFWGFAPNRFRQLVLALPQGERAWGWLSQVHGHVLTTDKEQSEIDALSEQLSWAISDLLNKPPEIETDDEVTAWEREFRAWMARVDQMLENSEVFTKTDFIHFHKLGFVEELHMREHTHYNWLLMMLKMKIDRLREITRSAQARL